MAAPRDCENIQDREFLTAIREKREPNGSVQQILPAMRTLDALEKSLLWNR
jgi:2-hydroxy-4-carboxymuconate semialdehyde hemiacetal dehydrogenase